MRGFEDLRDGSKQRSVAFVAYDLKNLMTSQLKNLLEFKNAVTLKILTISEILFLELRQTI